MVTESRRSAGGGDYRAGFLGVDEVVQLRLALLFVASDPHDVLAVFPHPFRVEIDQGLAHPFGVVDILAEDDGFLDGVGLGEKFADLDGHRDCALFQDQAAVEVLLIVDAVFDQLAVLVGLAPGGASAREILAQIDPSHLVGPPCRVMSSAGEWLSGFAGLTDDHDAAVAFVHHLVGHAAQPPASGAVLAGGADDDEIGLELVGAFNDAFDLTARFDPDLGAGSVICQFFVDLGFDALRFLVKGVSDDFALVKAHVTRQRSGTTITTSILVSPPNFLDSSTVCSKAL